MNMAVPAICVAAVVVVGSAFLASRFMFASPNAHQAISSLSSTYQENTGVSIEEFIKDFDTRKEDINRVNEQAEQEIEQLCRHIGKGDLTSDSAGLGYRASSRVKRSYKLAEDLYNITTDAKNKAESGTDADKLNEFCKYLNDCIYELSTTQEKFLSRCNMLLDSACSEG